MPLQPLKLRNDACTATVLVNQKVNKLLAGVIHLFRSHMPHFPILKTLWQPQYLRQLANINNLLILSATKNKKTKILSSFSWIGMKRKRDYLHSETLFLLLSHRMNSRRTKQHLARYFRAIPNCMSQWIKKYHLNLKKRNEACISMCQLW